MIPGFSSSLNLNVLSSPEQTGVFAQRLLPLEANPLSFVDSASHCSLLCILSLPVYVLRIPESKPVSPRSQFICCSVGIIVLCCLLSFLSFSIEILYCCFFALLLKAPGIVTSCSHVHKNLFFLPSF